jgi:hypothetical protein
MGTVGFSETSLNVILYGVTSEKTVSSGASEVLIITDSFFFQQRFFHSHFLYINMGTKCDGIVRIACSSMASSFSVQVYPSPCIPRVFIPYSFLPEMPYGMDRQHEFQWMCRQSGRKA